MSDFRSTTPFLKCDNLKIGGISWPKQYTTDNAYLKFTNTSGLEWQAASDSLSNVDVGFNDYLVMNQQKGGSGITIAANTNSYIRAGPGERLDDSMGSGGPDGRGTGITHEPRGQITIGLTHEDADKDSTDITIHGSSLKMHSSITDRELSFIGDKVKLQYPSSGEKLFQESPLSFKVTKGEVLKKENGLWISNNYKGETLTNKVLDNPTISGDIIFPKGKRNVEYGVNNGNVGTLSQRKEIPGIFKNHKGIDENSSNKDDEYKNWTIETTINDKKESNVIEEYNVGYQKLYGKFNNYNNPVNGENTFKYNDYYKGWNLSLSAYTKYTTNINSTHIIRPGTVFKIVKPGDSVTYYETLTSVCKDGGNTLFFENSQENYDGGTVSIEGIAESTTVTGGEATTNITINKSTTSFIPAKTNVTFSYSGGVDIDGIIQNDVEKGATSFTLTDASPDPGGNTLNIVIKPFNTSATTLAKVNYSEKIVDYTIKTGALQDDTLVTNELRESSTSISIDKATIGIIPVETILLVGGHHFKVTPSEVSVNSSSINVIYSNEGVSEPGFTVTQNTTNIYIRSLIAETVTFNDANRTSLLTQNNTLKNLSKQDVDSTFYISTQNKGHENGYIYGDRIGKMLGNKSLNIYHREDEGFYVGWNIYLWNTNIPLSNSLFSDIKATTDIVFTNPLDNTDKLEVGLGTSASTTSPNIITLPNNTEKNLDGYNVKIKGFPDGTTISSGQTTGQATLNLSNASEGVLGANTNIHLHDSNIPKDYYFTINAVSVGDTSITISPPPPGDVNLSSCTIKIMGIPDNTTVNLPSGIIEGYNSRLNTIQVLLNNKSYTVDSNTFYCLKKGYKTSGADQSYFVNLDSNKILHDGYYDNWNIEVESEKNKGYYESSSDYIIRDYKKQTLITNYDTNYSGVLVDSSTLPMTTTPVEANYFKDCRIVISSDSDVQSSTTNYKGIITSHDASIADTSKILTGTVIESVTTTTLLDSDVSKLTISPALNAEIFANTKILVTSSSGTTTIVEIGVTASANELTLTTTETNLEGGSVFMLKNMSNLVIQWDTPVPDNTQISSNNNFYITYNNTDWNDTNKRTLLYKTLQAESISFDSNENNTNRLTGFIELKNHSDGTTTSDTDRVELLSNLDTGTGQLTDFSPPSSIDDYYKGWKITLKFGSLTEKTFNILKYSGSDNIATIDQTIDTSENSVSSYILTKNLTHQTVIDDLFKINTYVTAINTTTNTLTINDDTLTTTIDDFRTILLSPPRVFKPYTTINSMTNTGIPYTEVTLNSDMDTLIKFGVGVELISKDNTYKTTVYEDATTVVGSNKVRLTSTPDINTIIGNTEEEYIINVIGESTRVPIKSVNNRTVILETNPYYNNVIGWYVSLYNDRKYKIYYDNYTGQGDLDGGKHYKLWNTVSTINDFYKNWTLQVEEYFDQIYRLTDASGNKIDEKFTKRSTLNIDEFDGSNQRVIRQVGYTEGTRDLGDTLGTEEYNIPKYAFYLVPSKNVKYSDNINSPSTNTIEYKLISDYKTDKNKLMETGIMQKENTISSLSNENDDYYNGWEITTYNTITSNNDKLIFIYNGTEKVIDITHGSYSGSELATELKSKLDTAVGGSPFTVEFLASSHKITFSAGLAFAFKWDKTYTHYFTTLHETLGFGKTDDSDYTTVTSPNKISLYPSKNGESSIIEKYDGTTKSIIVNNLRSKKGHPSMGTKSGNNTKYIITPPDHTNGSLIIKSSNDIHLNKGYSIGKDDFYNGWDIITYKNGSYQCSHITDYDNNTKKITAPSLDISLLSGNTSYSLRNQKHSSGYLRKNGKTVFPTGDKKGILDVTGFTGHIDGGSENDTDPTGISIKLYRTQPVSNEDITNFKWFNQEQPSTVDDYYKDWRISVYINNNEYHSTIKKYYGSDYRIVLNDLNIEKFLLRSTTVTTTTDGVIDTENIYKFILYEPSYYMLSFEAIPVDDYYNGWQINILNNGECYSSIISDYQGKDRKIIADSLPENLDESCKYEIVENVEGVMSDTLKLSNEASEITNYYVGWTLSTMDSSDNVVDTSEITTYNSYDKSVTLNPAINSTGSTTKYKLYFNSDNSIFGNSSGKNIYTGSRNIVIGSNAGPISTDNSISDKLYIDSDTNTRGINSFIYGNMTRGSEELKVNANLRIPDANMIYGDITGSAGGTSSFTTVDINGGSIDGTTIGANAHTTGKFTDVEATGNLTVTGNFTVNGTTTTIDTTSLVVEDPLIKLATNNNSGDDFDIGMYGQYNDGSGIKYSGIFRDASDTDRKWRIFKDLETAPENTSINTDGTGYAIGTLVSNIEGNLDGIVGGTTPATVTGTTITANTGFVGALDGIVGGTTPAAVTATTITANTGLITANAGISVKNGTTGSGFIDFYEDDDEGQNYIKLQCPATFTGSSELTLPTTGGVIVSTGDTETVSSNMLTVVSGLTAQSYGSSTAIPVITVDIKGRVTVADTTPISTTLDITGDDSGSTTVSMQESDNQSLKLSGTNNVISTTVTAQEVTFNLDNTGVTAAAYGSSTDIPVITVDSQGRITAATVAGISTDLGIAGDTGADTISIGTDTLQFTGGTGINTSIASDTVTYSIDNTVATLTGSQTLTNKTLTTPTISSILNTGTLTLPTSTDTLVGKATTDTLTNKTFGDDIEVQGGEIKFWGGRKQASSTDSNARIWVMSSPDGHTSNDTNNDTSLQITNSGRGVTSPDSTHYKNTLIGWNMPTDPGSQNTIIGSGAGELATGSKNVFLGMSSGYQLTSANNNICIGPETGPGGNTGLESTDGQLYIDTSKFGGGYKGSDSLIYGNQSSSTLQTLSLNAAVTISKANSAGTLEVQGGEITMKGGGDGLTTNPEGDDLTNGNALTWKMKVVKGGSYNSTDADYYNSNLQITTDDYGLRESISQATYNTYENLIIGGKIGHSLSNSHGIGNVLLGHEVASGRDHLGLKNVFIGYKCGANMNGGQQNVAIGTQALYNLTVGQNNISIGYQSGFYLTGYDGIGDQEKGKMNIFIGKSAGGGTTTGYRNTCIGCTSGYNITTGDRNVCIGNGSGPASADGAASTRLYINCLGTTSSAPLGENSLIYGDQGTNAAAHTLSFNAAVTVKKTSTSAGTLEVQGGEIKFWGYDKVANSSNGNIWTLSSPESGTSNIDDNLLIGTSSTIITESDIGGKYHNVTLIGYGAKARGDYVTAVGNFAGNDLAVNSHGETVYGYKAGRTFKGNYNAAVGYETMGGAAGISTNLGTQNVYFGFRAGGLASGGNSNCGIGAYSLYRIDKTNVTQGNVGIGYASGQNITSGVGNMCVGYYAGNHLTSGDKNICIGWESGPSSGSDRIDDNNKLYIDAGENYADLNSLIYGDQSGSNQDLTFNADVVISTTTNSSGNLTVYGDITGKTSVRAQQNARSNQTGYRYPIPFMTNSDANTEQSTPLAIATENATAGGCLKINHSSTNATELSYDPGNSTVYADNFDGRLIGDARHVYIRGQESQQTSTKRFPIPFIASTNSTSTSAQPIVCADDSNSNLTGTFKINHTNDTAEKLSYAPLSGTLYATNFVGNGSGLTGITATVTNATNANRIQTTHTSGSSERHVMLTDTAAAADGSVTSYSQLFISSSSKPLKYNTHTGSLTVSGYLNVGNSDGMNTNVMRSVGVANSGYVLMGKLGSGAGELRRVMNSGTQPTVAVVESNDSLRLYEFSNVCFLPGTKITLSNNIKINIEKLKKGDTLLSYKLDDMEPYTKSVDVLSWFSEDDTGEFTESEVSNIWSDKSPGYIILNDNLHVTHEHLIFTKVDDEYTWLSAKEIRKGDIVFTDKGEYEEITKIEKIKEEVTVYNLRVTSSAMNYFADSYLVHNASLCDECAAKNNKL